MFLGDITLTRRIEAAEAASAAECAEALNRLRPDSDAAAMPVAGGWAAFVRPGSPLNHAVGLGMAGPVTGPEISELERFYRSHGEPATVDVCPLAHRSLAELLSLRGYRVTEFNNVLVRPLSQAEAPPEPCGIAEVSAVDEATAERWAAVVARGFLERAELTPPEIETGLVLFHLASGTSYDARVEGRDAGGGCLLIHEELALLFADSTVPEFRGRGVQCALIATRLRDAAARGCDLAAASTLPGSGSQRNYERLGFRPAYTRVVMVNDH